MDPTLYNTLTRSKELLRPLEYPKVGLYTCGPTVYNYQHVGNYRTYVFEDALKRALGLLGFTVRHVMNITDVGHLTSQADEGEDKVEMKARAEGKTAWQVAEFYTQAFLADARELNILPPDELCKATDNIPEQIELVKRLEAKGLTYRTSDGIYYDTSKFPEYGRLMGPSYREGLEAGARVEVNPEKRSPQDFALWKFSPKGGKRDMEWDSPWGKGFPGWHIECSAMAMKYLGETFDIHCGGVDHIPIHHTNEIAQTEGATGKPFVRVWMHGEFLLMNEAKMAKSAGGFVTLRDLKEGGFDPLDYRYLCLTAHYRRQLNFTWPALDGAKTARRRLKDRAHALKQEGVAPSRPAGFEGYWRKFKTHLADDLDLPNALETLWAALKPGALSPGAQLAMLEDADQVLGAGLAAESAEAPPPELAGLLARRQKAREARDFAASDRLRKEIEAKGFLVEDTPKGQRWKRK